MIFIPPSTAIRNYFGEKIAYYFEFLGLYSRYLMASPLIGIALFFIFNVFGHGHWVTRLFYCIYAIVTILWTTIFLEHLKRKSNARAIEWGQAELQEDEIIRPQFSGRARRSPINDDLQEPWYPMFKKVFKVTITSIILSFLLFVSLAVAGGLQYLSNYMGTEVWHDQGAIIWSTIITAVIQGFMILLLDWICRWIIYGLTKFENHKTKVLFENSYVIKIFLFRFVNNFASLFFIAFAKQYIIGCVDVNTQRVTRNTTCMWELKYQSLCIFIVYILQNVYEICKPLIRILLNRSKYLGKVRQTE